MSGQAFFGVDMKGADRPGDRPTLMPGLAVALKASLSAEHEVGNKRPLSTPGNWLSEMDIPDSVFSQRSGAMRFSELRDIATGYTASPDMISLISAEPMVLSPSGVKVEEPLGIWL